MCMIGPTGIGKSAVLNHTFAGEMYQQVRRPEGFFSPIIRIDARPNITTKGIAELLLVELKDEKPSRGTEHDMVERVFKQLKKQKTCLIIIDEAQCLASKGYHASDFLKHLLNKGGCPLLLVGLGPTEDLLDLNSQLKGRSLATVMLPAFDYTKEKQRDEWRGLLKKLQAEVKKLQGPIDLSGQAVAAALNFATRGLLRELRELLDEAIDIADQREGKITMEALADAFDRRRSKFTKHFVNPFRGQDLPEVWKPAGMFEGADQSKIAKRKTAAE